MRALRFLAIVPLALGLWVLAASLLWTEWVWLLYVVGLFAVAAAMWRVFAGRWPMADRLNA